MFDHDLFHISLQEMNHLLLFLRSLLEVLYDLSLHLIDLSSEADQFINARPECQPETLISSDKLT